jgi:hypothetical protein
VTYRLGNGGDDSEKPTFPRLFTSSDVSGDPMVTPTPKIDPALQQLADAWDHVPHEVKMLILQAAKPKDKSDGARIDAG